MDAIELLRKWPSWEKANAATVLASPAWRMPVRFAGRDATLRMGDAPAVLDAIPLGVSFDGEEHVLGIFDSEMFHDLHLLWDKRGALPDEIVLALVEKECGTLLQLLEDTVRKQLSVEGLKTDGAPFAGKMFVLDVDGRSLTFSLDVSPAMEIEFGKLEYLDPAHDSIRSLTRPAEAEYSVVPLTEDEFGSLAVGDFVIPPEDSVPRWTVEKPLDGQLHLYGAEGGTLSFAEMADDALPPVPECDSFCLVRFGRKCAVGTRSRVGDRMAVKVEGML